MLLSSILSLAACATPLKKTNKKLSSAKPLDCPGQKIWDSKTKACILPLKPTPENAPKYRLELDNETPQHRNEKL